MPAATMTTMTNTAPIAVTQPKSDPTKMGIINNNRQGRPQNQHFNFCESVKECRNGLHQGIDLASLFRARLDTQKCQLSYKQTKNKIDIDVIC